MTNLTEYKIENSPDSKGFITFVEESHKNSQKKSSSFSHLHLHSSTAEESITKTLSSSSPNIHSPSSSSKTLIEKNSLQISSQQNLHHFITLQPSFFSRFTIFLNSPSFIFFASFFSLKHHRTILHFLPSISHQENHCKKASNLSLLFLGNPPNLCNHHHLSALYLQATTSYFILIISNRNK
ncbi:hypothetical protein RYX36_031420 [Vicia faba]